MMNKIIPLLLVVFSLAGCSSASILMTGQARKPIPPEQVRVFLRNDAPPEYEQIGIVKAVYKGPAITEQGKQDGAIDLVKEKAATVGANGVILMQIGEVTETGSQALPGGVVMPLTETYPSITGLAIYFLP